MGAFNVRTRDSHGPHSPHEPHASNERCPRCKHTIWWDILAHEWSCPHCARRYEPAWTDGDQHGPPIDVQRTVLDHPSDPHIPPGCAANRIPVPRLRELRLTRGVNQQDIATRLGISRTLVTHWESGTRLPTLHVTHAIASLLDIHVIDLTNFQEVLTE